MTTQIDIPNTSKTYLDRPYVQVFWEPTDKILTSRWTGFCTFDEIKAVASKIIDAVTIEGARKVLYDVTDIEVLDEESQRYIAGQFTREMVKAGIVFGATVSPKDIFAKFSVEDIQNSIDVPTASNNRYFHSLDEASSWLRERQS